MYKLSLVFTNYKLQQLLCYTGCAGSVYINRVITIAIYLAEGMVIVYYTGLENFNFYFAVEMHDDQMPYSCAIESGNVDLALYLLNQISYPKHQYKYTLKMACEQGRQDVVEEIIEVEWLSLTSKCM